MTWITYDLSRTMPIGHCSLVIFYNFRLCLTLLLTPILLNNSSVGTTDTSVMTDDRPDTLRTKRDNAADIDFMATHDEFYPEFGLSMKHIGFLNPTIKNYLISLKYDFNSLKSYNWVHDSMTRLNLRDVPYISLSRGGLASNLYRLLGAAKWLRWLQVSTINRTVLYPDMEPYIQKLITVESSCQHVSTIYYNGSLDMKYCIKRFNYHLDHNMWSYYTIHLLMDVLDIGSTEVLVEKGRSAFVNRFNYINSKHIRDYKPEVYKMFLNITIQYMNIRFSQGVRDSSMVFEQEIDYILDEVNAYIPRFITKSDVPDYREKRALLSALLTIGGGLFSAWKFYKDYTFKRNLRRTLHHILKDNKNFKFGIMTNRRNLVSLADITASNFKDLRKKFVDLRNITWNNFNQHTTDLINTQSDSIFYRNYLLFYIDAIDKVNFDLALYNNKLQTAKSILYTKCRTFISGLHTLAENKIPESILHADVFNKMLLEISDNLKKETNFDLLYGTVVNPYYHMPIVKSFIINNVLYMNIMLPLQHIRTPLMSVYSIESHYLPTNMSADRSSLNSYTKLVISHPFIIYNNLQYAYLKDNFEKSTIMFDNLHVPTLPIMLFNRNSPNCYLNIVRHADMKEIMSSCTFDFYKDINIIPSLITTTNHFYLMNIFSTIVIDCGIEVRNVKILVHAISAVERSALCQCSIKSKHIYLVGTETNCTSEPNFKVEYTFNFVTEWINDKVSMPFYQEGLHLLRVPSSTYFPNIKIKPGLQVNNVYTDDEIPSISLSKLEQLIEVMKTEDNIFKSVADKDNYNMLKRLNGTDVNNDDILELDAWFNTDMNYTMIFIFISSIVSVIAFIFLLFLCYKSGKFQYTLSYLLGAGTGGANAQNIVNYTEVCAIHYLYFHLAVAIFVVAGVYIWINVIIKLYRHFRVYNTTLYFRRRSGLAQGRNTSINLEFSNFNNTHTVHVATLRTPIALLSAIDIMSFPKFTIKSDTTLTSRLVLSCPIYFKHLDCENLIPTQKQIVLGFYQAYQLRKMFKGDYLTRVIAFQNSMMIPLSKLNPSNLGDLPNNKHISEIRQSLAESSDEPFNIQLPVHDIEPTAPCRLSENIHVCDIHHDGLETIEETSERSIESIVQNESTATKRKVEIRGIGNTIPQQTSCIYPLLY